jgi:hypothetical protein
MISSPSDQERTCERYGAQYVPCDSNLMVGISKNFDPKVLPINGLRHPPVENTTGWYIWSGEQFSEEPDFFVPIHAAHLNEECTEIVRYLGLAPGWRFLYAPTQEDVWFDEQLLRI